MLLTGEGISEGQGGGSADHLLHPRSCVRHRPGQSIRHKLLCRRQKSTARRLVSSECTKARLPETPGARDRRFTPRTATKLHHPAPISAWPIETLFAVPSTTSAPGCTEIPVGVTANGSPPVFTSELNVLSSSRLISRGRVAVPTPSRASRTSKTVIRA